MLVLNAVVNLLLMTVVFSAIIGWVAVRKGVGRVWQAWAACLLLFNTVALWRMSQFPALWESRLVTLYMMAAFTALPTAAATWAVVRRVRRVETTPVWRLSLVSMGVMIAVLPIAVLVGAIPDLMTLFGS